MSQPRAATDIDARYPNFSHGRRCSEFEKAIAEYEGDDPLEPWVRCVRALPGRNMRYLTLDMRLHGINPALRGEKLHQVGAQRVSRRGRKVSCV